MMPSTCSQHKQITHHLEIRVQPASRLSPARLVTRDAPSRPATHKTALCFLGVSGARLPPPKDSSARRISAPCFFPRSSFSEGSAVEFSCSARRPPTPVPRSPAPTCTVPGGRWAAPAATLPAAGPARPGRGEAARSAQRRAARVRRCPERRRAGPQPTARGRASSRARSRRRARAGCELGGAGRVCAASAGAPPGWASSSRAPAGRSALTRGVGGVEPAVGLPGHVLSETGENTGDPRGSAAARAALALT